MNSALLVVAAILFSTGASRAQAAPDTAWDSATLTFRPLAITVHRASFWAAGTAEGIASSADGRTWQVKHAPVVGGGMLLGIDFASDQFGYTFGTGGTLLTTVDGGATWKIQPNTGDRTILLAALADSDHGILRTKSGLYLLDGDEMKPVSIPKDVPAEFRYVPALAALSPERMTIAVSQGWRSETGFVSTIDRGKSWSFYDPPHIVPYDLLAVAGVYWTIGAETVGYDKPGGGFGVPLVMSSTDGRTWKHTSADVHACHWEGCDLCRAAGCMASTALLVNPYGDKVATHAVPAGHATPYWAATENRFCVIDGALYCAFLAPAEHVDKAGPPQPDEPTLPPLGAKEPEGMLRCVRCSLTPLFVDPKVQGQFRIQLSITVGADGVVRSPEVKGAPSESIRQQMLEQISAWLFEPPQKDHKPVNVATKQDLTINVIRSR